MEQFEKFEKELKTFSGYIAKDVEMKYFDNGGAVAKFVLPLKAKKEDEATWLNVEIFNKLAEKIAEDYKKGDFITVSGYFKESEYKGKKYVTLVGLLAG